MKPKHLSPAVLNPTTAETNRHEETDLKQLFAALCLSTASYQICYTPSLTRLLRKRMRRALRWRLCLEWDMILKDVARQEIIGNCGETAYVLHLDNLDLVVVRGSDDPWDWFRNIQANLVPFEAIHQSTEAVPMVHQGFLNCAEALREPLAAHLRNHLPVLWCGHSMGGAVAVLLARLMAPERSRVLTLGAPHWTSHPQHFHYHNQPMDVVNLINLNDPVPFVCQVGTQSNQPLLPYQRMGVNHYLLGNGRIVFNGDESELTWRNYTVFAHSCLAYHAGLVDIMEGRGLSTQWAAVAHTLKEFP